MPSEDEILQSLRPQVTTATLHAVAEKASEARDIELEISNLEERLKKRKADLRNIYMVELPNLMDQAQTDRIGIPATGNLPACDLKLTPYYHAQIAASWPQEKRNAAFAALTQLGHQDLIKTDLVISLPREDRASVPQLLETLKKLGLIPQVKENVHFKTLTAWLKEQYERGNPLPPLETIGAEVGRIVKMIERK